MKWSRSALLGACAHPAMRHHAPVLALLSAIGALAAPPDAYAQDQVPRAAPEDTTLGEVIVTAQKRATSLQTTPIAITAMTGEQLAAAQVDTLNDVSALVPGLRIGSGQGVAQITIRGIGSSNLNPGGESPSAVNVNEVYVSRQTGVLTSLYDIDSLEILRGPQGTLYGRNATAGAINIKTTRPSLLDWGGYFAASAGNYSAIDLEAAVGGPIVPDKLGLRVAAFVDRHDGYFTNIATGNGTEERNAKGVRGTLLAQPVEHLTATLIADYYLEKERAAAFHYFGADSQIQLPAVYPAPPSILFAPGGYLPSSIEDIASGFDPRLRLRTYSVSGVLDWSFEPFTLRSITAYRNQKFATAFSIDGGAAPRLPANGLVIKGEPSRQFSQEVQARYDSDRVHVTAGAYYFRETTTGVGHVLLNTAVLFANPAINVRGLPAPSPAFYDNTAELSGVIKTRAEAVFAQVEYKVVDDLTLTAGARYSHERKTYLSNEFLNIPLTTTHPVAFDPAHPLAGSSQRFVLSPPEMADPADFSSFTPHLGVQYQVNPGTMVYVSYSKGFKAGGFDVSSPASVPAFGPEKLDSFEVGVKADLLDGRARLNLSAFHYKYSDLQVQQIVGFGIFTQNAGSAVSNGGEVELSYKPSEGWLIYLSGTYLDAHYTNFVGASPAQVLRQFVFPASPNVDFKGKRLNNAPRETAFASVERSWEIKGGRLVAKGEVEYSGRYYFTADNVSPLDQSAYSKVHLSVRYENDDAWTLSAYVRNLTDKVTKTSAAVFTAAVGAPIGGSVSDPRTFGVKVEHRF